MESIDDAELLPIQEAAKRFNVSLASLHKYAALGRIRKYRRGFDRVTYVDGHEIAGLSSPATASWFLVELPIEHGSKVFKRILTKLQAKAPNRRWQWAGIDSFVLVDGARSNPYTALKYRAHDQRAVLTELADVLNEADPTGRLIERRKVSLKEYPFADEDPA